MELEAGERLFVEDTRVMGGVSEVEVLANEPESESAHVRFVDPTLEPLELHVPWTHLYATAEECRDAAEHFFSAFTRAIQQGTSLREELAEMGIRGHRVLPEDYDATVTVEELAKKFGVAERVVRSWISQRRLRAKKIGREYVITAASLKAFLNLNEEQLRLAALARFINGEDMGALEKMSPSGVEAMRLEARQIVEGRLRQRRCARCGLDIPRATVPAGQKPTTKYRLTDQGLICAACAAKGR
jgi:excisionase family DNA binding protein